MVLFSFSVGMPLVFLGISLGHHPLGNPSENAMPSHLKMRGVLPSSHVLRMFLCARAPWGKVFARWLTLYNCLRLISLCDFCMHPHFGRKVKMAMNIDRVSVQCGTDENVGFHSFFFSFFLIERLCRLF
jgi:hypothetical protein